MWLANSWIMTLKIGANDSSAALPDDDPIGGRG